jgi:hypothetical protein
MTALALGRKSDQMGTQVEPTEMTLGMAASTTIYMGSIVCKNAAGYAVPGSADATLLVVGCSTGATSGLPTASVVNSGAAGAVNINVRRGVFKFENSTAGDAITFAHVGKPCYVVDDQTVALTSAGGTRPFAGTVMGVDSSANLQLAPTGAGVFVQLGVPGSAMAQAVAGMIQGKGADLTDAALTITLAQGTWRVLPAATLGAARILTLSNTGAYAGAQITITRLDATANTYTIEQSGGTDLVVLPASKVNFADFQHDGTDWFLKRVGTQ